MTTHLGTYEGLTTVAASDSRAVEAWRASGPAYSWAKEASDGPVVQPCDRLAPLPDFEIWSCAAIEAMSAALTAPGANAGRQAMLSKLIDATIWDQVVTRALGRPFTYAQQCDGDLFQNLIPRAGRENEQSNAGRTAFKEHTDDSILEDELRAENLLLVGVDNPGMTPTKLLPIDSILERLDSDVVRTLGQPRYTFGCPESFQAGGQRNVRSPARRILSLKGGSWHIRFATYSTAAQLGDGGAAEALSALKHAISVTQPTSIVLTPGVFLTFSNSRYLHSREAVRGRRWVKRVYLRRNLKMLEDGCATTATAVFDLQAAVEASIN